MTQSPAVAVACVNARRPAQASVPSWAATSSGSNGSPRSRRRRLARLGHADDRVGQRELMLGVDADVDQRGDGVRRLRGDPAHRLGELGVDPRAATEQQQERLAVLGDPVEVGAKPALGALATVLGVRGGGRDRRDEPVPDVVEQCLVEVTLGLEVLVQHGLGDARGVGDVVHRGLVIPGAGERAQGDGEQLLAPVDRGQARGHAYPMVTTPRRAPAVTSCRRGRPDRRP